MRQKEEAALDTQEPKFFRENGKVYVEYTQIIPPLEEVIPQDFKEMEEFTWWKTEYDAQVEGKNIRVPIKSIAVYLYDSEVDGPLPPDDEIENR